MNQVPDGDVERLQRELEAHKNRTLELEQQLIHAKLNPLSPAQDFFPANAFGPSHNAVQGIRTAALARSKSNLGFTPSMASPVIVQDISNYHALRRQGRALSQQTPASQSMSRSYSNRSEAAMPFRQTGPVAPLSSTSPTSSHFFAPQIDSVSHRLASVEENGTLPEVGIDPSVYIANTWDGEGQAQSYLATTGTNLYPHDPYNRQISTCPSMVSGSTLNEGPTPLTRQNSSFGSPAGMNMTRLTSSQSFVSDEWSSQDPLFPQQHSQSQAMGKSSASDQVLMGLGANLPEAPPKYSSSPSNPNLFLSSPLSASMDRSESNTSISSVKSSASQVERRAKEARVRVLQNQNSRAVLAPKPTNESEGQTTGDAKGASLDPSKDGKTSPKGAYRRPKHPKVFCNLCTDHPEGFRGDHELRRHINAKHEGVVKKFVCRDPATVGIVSNVAVRHPLSKCKACTSGKQYGAYYNAAAHLRRTHFKPKAVRGKNKGANDERRGGKGGGDWPCMTDLKAWFEEVHVAVNQVPVLSDQDDDEDMVPTGMDITSGAFPVIDGDMSSYGAVDNNTLSLGEIIDPTIGLTSASIPIAPISSASVSFSYTGFHDDSQLSAIPNEYAFSEHGAPTYGSTISSNTITPSTFHDMNHLGVSDGGWEIADH